MIGTPLFLLNWGLVHFASVLCAVLVINKYVLARFSVLDKCPCVWCGFCSLVPAFVGPCVLPATTKEDLECWAVTLLTSECTLEEFIENKPLFTYFPLLLFPPDSSE